MRFYETNMLFPCSGLIHKLLEIAFVVAMMFCNYSYSYDLLCMMFVSRMNNTWISMIIMTLKDKDQVYLPITMYLKSMYKKLINTN